LLYLNNNHHTVKSSALQKKLEKEEDHFMVRQQQVYRKVTTEDGKHLELKFIPFAERADLVYKYHDAFGHAGIKTMLKMFSSRYWWPAMRKDIQEWLRTCAACQLNGTKSKAHQDVMHPLDIPKAFDRWHLDFVGELKETESGNKWLLTAVDYLTNWPIARAVPVASQEAVADFIYEEIVMRFGCPSEIITDRGANFTSGLVKAYTKRVGINHKLTSAFHPRTNSKVERYNGVIKQMLRKYVNGAIHIWDQFVNAALWASRVRVHSTTGFSPFYLTYGREPRLPGDILQPYLTREILSDPRTIADINSRELQLLNQHRAAAEFRLKAMGEHDKKKWDEKIKPLNFETGDQVLLTHEGKIGLEPRFKGPYVVTQVFSDYGTYKLETVAGEPLKSLVHVDRLKRFVGDKPTTPHYDPTSVRREIREAERNRPSSTTFPVSGSTSKSSSSVLPSASTTTTPMDVLGPDFIDPVITSVPSDMLQEPPSSSMFPLTAQADFQMSPILHSNSDNTEIIADIDSEDLSLHGSSIMDEDNEDLVMFRSILDGYDHMSSADEQDILDIEIEDSPFSSSPHVIADTSDTDVIPSLDERSSEPNLDSHMRDNEIISIPVVPSPVLTPIPIASPPKTVPTSRFSFKAPVVTTVSKPLVISSAAPSSSKPIDLSYHLPPTLSSSVVSKPSPSTSTTTSDVPGRTSVSKGGNVGLDSSSSSDIDLHVSSNWNKNKRKQFKPVTPMRDKKRKLFYVITQAILNRLSPNNIK
jgi:hypothetical protein